MELVQAHKKPEIKKHSATIHCSNQLTLLQRKVCNALLYHAYHELLQVEEHQVTVKDLCRIINYNGNNHKVIKDSLRGLLSTVMEWNIVSDETKEEDWTASTILASVNIKGPLCSYAYSPRMKKLLHQPTMYGTINLIVQSKFKSTYGLALYENCVRYQNMKYTKWFEYDVFRKLMGVPSDEYLKFRDFKRRVLDKSVAEVNQHSDLQVQTEINRKGQKVLAIRFALAKKNVKALAEEGRVVEPSIEKGAEDNLPTAENVLISKLESLCGMKKHLALQLLKEHGAALIEEKLQYILSSASYKRGQIKNVAGYLIKAIKDDYAAAKEIELKKKDSQNDKKQEQRRAEYRTYTINEIVKKINAMEAAEQRNILEDYKAYLKRSKQGVNDLILERSGLQSAAKDFLFDYAKTEAHSLLEGLESFADFCQRKNEEEPRPEKA